MQEFKNNFEFQTSPLAEAYLLLGATSAQNLSVLYTMEDQKIMKAGKWDYANPELVVNKVKDILERVGETGLTDEEKEWRQEILWFWYHHAISCAIWRYHDKEMAKKCAEEALGYQSENHPNKITQLLAFLVNDNLADAEEWAKNIENEVEKKTAHDLIEGYKKHGFF